ncbi:uncharacterized protein SRS1_17271 [Sporisorium reilianum f. sp. reilianum]|uniref:Uncharacterized protein n=1 Tax=Sporisorium reilianum f. sp. reilianum TaxID=72559 RepID=A0A2N8UP44_9BASI|nr:uncharacterized protein SRS1_17271 [Sporisorium reilianum f. sp. reilianum]
MRPAKQLALDCASVRNKSPAAREDSPSDDDNDTVREDSPEASGSVQGRQEITHVLASPFGNLPGVRIAVNPNEWSMVNLDAVKRQQDFFIPQAFDVLPLDMVRLLRNRVRLNVIGRVTQVGKLEEKNNQFWRIKAVGATHTGVTVDFRLFPFKNVVLNTGATIDLNINDIVVILNGSMFSGGVSACRDSFVFRAEKNFVEKAKELVKVVHPSTDAKGKRRA